MLNTSTATQKTAASVALGSDQLRTLALGGMFMAMNIAVSSYGIPVPGGHLYLCDAVICTAAILLAPFPAMLVGGIGAFLGDMIFYPAPMFVSLVTHGLQALVISLLVHRKAGEQRRRFPLTLLATLIGALIMVIGYTLGKAFVYGSRETAIIGIPYEAAQSLLGVVLSLFLCFKCGLIERFEKLQER